jgi:hypothetical protein
MPYFAFSTIERIVGGGWAAEIGQVQQNPSEPAYGTPSRGAKLAGSRDETAMSISPITVAARNDAALGKAHARRLREIYRSAGWPCQDLLEIELLAAGMLDRVRSAGGHETLRVTDAGVRMLAATLASNRAAFTAHESLVEQVALEMWRAGRVAWRGLSLRAQVPQEGNALETQWCIAKPDVFSIRNTSVANYVDPVVHEVKVRRADLLGDLKHAAKRAAYLDLGECWYVLGCDAKGRAIAEPDEVPAECGVMIFERGRFTVARAAPRRSRNSLPFGVWMALAKATPIAGLDEDAQAMLGPLE